ncbi:MAG: dihydrodipicolinate synthase family protein [Chitinophagaceae bacterium]|nr:dihydrodipicolinate synthase family protein [Chitinophagaceae bacterium]
METTKYKKIGLPAEIAGLLYSGTVIPAHPLVLKKDSKQIDEPGQRALTRYYINSGAGGVAVGVHTTQFEIRDETFQLLEPVLKTVAEEIDSIPLERPFLKVAGICGETKQAIAEAETAWKYGYHLGLLSMGGLSHYSEDALLERVKEVTAVIPVFGFYLQPAVGGRVLSYEFWKKFAEIPGVYAIKIAAFNRYHTIDVVQAVCNSSRRDEIALYTGNDDNIVADLLTPYRFTVNGKIIEKTFVGGLLGHWAFCTAHAVNTLKEVKHCINNGFAGIDDMLAKGIEVTDTNAAVFDVEHHFHGCIAGIHEMLRREGVMQYTGCLLAKEVLSPGQLSKIKAVCEKYFPELGSK